MQYLMLLGAAMLLAVSFSMQKIYREIKEGTRSACGYNSVLGLFTAIIFFIINGCKFNFSPYSFLMAMLVNAFVTFYTLIGFKLLKSATMATYTLFIMSGGMIVPYIYGILFLNEDVSVLKIFGLLFVLGGVVFSNFSKEKINIKQLVMCVLIFLINGFVSVFSKLHQIEQVFYKVNAEEFVMIGGIFKFIFAGILFMFTKNENGSKQSKKIALPVLVIVISAAASGISYMLQLFGATSLPATVLYPLVTGGSIIFSSLAGAMFFGDKLSKNAVIGIILCFMGTVMFL